MMLETKSLSDSVWTDQRYHETQWKDAPFNVGVDLDQGAGSSFSKSLILKN